MKVMWVMEIETFKEDTRRKKFYESYQKLRLIWKKKHEGIKYKDLGGWGVQPGKFVYLYEYESMEEFSKIWSDMEIQALFVKYRNLCKDFKINIWRPTVSVPPK